MARRLFIKMSINQYNKRRILIGEKMYCSYCSSKIFESDRTCPRCGGPTKNYLESIQIPLQNTKEQQFKNAKLRLTGYTQSDFVATCQRISAWNGGRKVVAICNRDVLGYIIPSNANFRYCLDVEKENIDVQEFLGVNLTTNYSLLSKARAMFGGTENSIYFVCVENNDFCNVYGMIDCSSDIVNYGKTSLERKISKIKNFPVLKFFTK
jgi:hypothetical protein